MSASVQRVDHVRCVDLNFASATLLVDHDESVDVAGAVERAVVATGHGLTRIDEAGEVASTVSRSWLDTHLAEVATAGSGALSAAGIVGGWLGMGDVVTTACFVIAIVFGGLLVWRRAFVSLRARILDMNVLMTVAVLGAAALGEWGEAATVYFLFALGGLLESRSLERTRRSIRDLMSLSPAVARVRRHGEWLEIPAPEVAIDDLVRVLPGERVPVDGEIDSGASAFDESAITGESVPAEKAEGDTVFAGTLNATGVVQIRATSAAKDSTLARIVFLVEEAQASRAPSQTLVDRFSRWYTPSVIVLAAAIAVLGPVVATLAGEGGAQTWIEWIRRALVLLVVSCPCALVISTPVSIVSAITRASRDGVLVKGGAFLESAATIKVVAFDKTGTLTRGLPAVTGVELLRDGDDSAMLLEIAGALESHSTHPIARAVVRAANTVEAKRGDRDPVVSDFFEMPGRGVRGTIDGVTWQVCSPGCAEQQGVLALDGATQAVERVEGRGETALVLFAQGAPRAVIGVADELRAETPAAVVALKNAGIEHVVMLTGDNERVAAAVSKAAGVTQYRARLLPEAKTAAIAELSARHGAVAMVGDGINDAPALARADIGIAMGAAGTDTALETADVALMRDDLSALPGFFDLSRRTVATIKTNVAFSVIVKFVFLVLAVMGMANLWMAVFADTGVSLLVILNGMRLLRRRKGSARAHQR